MSTRDVESTDMVQSGSLTRRRFLAAAAAAGTAALGVPAMAEAGGGVGPLSPDVQRDVDVAVVGGGISGLAAARRLVQNGRSTVVLEASGRTGGRIYDAHLKGAVLETGAEWVADDEKHIMALIREFGIKTFNTYGQGKLTFVEGDLIARTSGGITSLPGDVGAAVALVFATLEEMVRQVPLAAPYRAPHAREWDSQTVRSWLNENVPVPQIRDALAAQAGGILGFDARDISLLHYLFVARAAGGVEQLSSTKGVLQKRVVGGPQQITNKMAAELGGRVVLNAPVRTIDQSGARVRLYTDRGVFTAERVIVAVPPMMAGRILYEPILPAKRDQLTQRAPMGWDIKGFPVYATPFWRKQGLSGQVNDVTPGSPIVSVFDNTPPDGHPSVLFALIGGDAARRLGPLRPARRKAIVLKQLAKYFGPEAARPIAYADYSWAAVPWSRGGAGMGFGPGTWTEYGTTLRKPVGRIHWAATETATEFWGDMEGAIAAAYRAVGEVM